MAEYVRTFWKGHLRLALVSIPIRLVTAEKAEAEIHFHQVDRESKKRIKYIKVVPGKGEIKKENIAMAYETEPGNYVFMDDDELDHLKLKSRQVVELTQFVNAGDIDPLYFERPYYVVPDGEEAEEGYRVIRDALKQSKKVGIGQLTLRGKENLVALFPGGKGLVLDTLRYDNELKDADEAFEGVKNTPARADMMEMAADLIKGRTSTFDPSKYKNHYAEALRQLVDSKLDKGQTVAVDDVEEPAAGKVIDFMDALKRSVAGGSGAKKSNPIPTKSEKARALKKRSA
jgi:DNA end-binding protein Ku